MKGNSKKVLRFVISIAICELAGVIGSVFTISNIPVWYATLAKPFFAPPNWLFGPAWTLLYFLMGAALFLIWEKGFVKPIADPVKKQAKKAVGAFSVQLALNVIWSFLFFGLRNPLYGLIEIIVMWIAIAYTIKTFYPVSKKAAWLLVPYILWVSFATALNAAVWMLNP